MPNFSIASIAEGKADSELEEAWIWHPDKPVIFKQVMFRKRETLHATREFFRTTAAKTVKMMDVSDYINKFRTAFEPKPKPPPEVKPKSELAKATETVERKIAEITRPTQNPAPRDVGILPTCPDSTVAAVEIRRPVTGLETRKPTLPASDREVTGGSSTQSAKDASTSARHYPKPSRSLHSSVGCMNAARSNRRSFSCVI